VRRYAKASFAGSTPAGGIRRGRLGLICLCVLGLAAFLGSGAPSASAQACPNEAFRQGPSAHLPDCRAYEMVTPADMEGYEAFFGAGNSAGIAPTAAPSGNTVAYSVRAAAFGDSPSSGGSAVYLARRGASDWDTEGISPPADPYASTALNLTFGFTEDLGKAVIEGYYDPPLTPDAAPGTSSLYVQDNGSGSFTLVSVGAPPEQKAGNFFADGMSSDAGTVTFSSKKYELTPDSATAAKPYYYQWNAATGAVGLVGRAPVTDEVLTGKVTLAGRNYRRPVSADGSRIFFTGGGSGCGLCVRIDGSTTHVVASAGTFEFANTEGSLAYIREGGELKIYDVNADELSSSLAGEVQGVLGTSVDGSRVYFVSKEELAPGATAGENNLYLWTEVGGFEFIATGITLTSNWSTGSSGPTSRVTPDGMHLAFTANNSLTGYEDGGHAEAYLYSAATGELTCASCNPIAAPATFDATIGGSNSFEVARLARSLSDDGSRLFFTTNEALAPQDSNEQEDVYEFDAASGEVALISTGAASGRTRFDDASASGNDVLLRSREQLVGIAQNGILGVFDARVDGGLASQNPPAQAPPCTGDACRGGSSTPNLAAPASAGFVGKGNISAKQNCNKLGKEAKNLSKRAKGLRKNAKKVKKAGNSSRAKKLNKKSNRLAKQARNKSKSAKKCRKRNRRASK
jgi:hypothetical protein